ncbi:hypothetical protein [Streptomyces albicerus]|uniref:hypothetical protein n=1 Tax=Streptomyces albicerus TaxID=2569859 RepID=UPI00124B3649|nr:hypothetical protein [Streptomyces albicerus]
MAGWDHGVLQAGGAGWIGGVEQVVVQGSEADGDAGLFQQGVLDRRVIALRSDAVADLVEGPGQLLGAGSETDRLVRFVGVEQVPQAADPGGFDRRVQVLGPGRRRGGIALRGAVGQGP